MNKSVCVIYVIYNPNVELLKSSISSLIKQVEEVIIYKNSPCYDFLDDIFSNKVSFLGDGYNVGIASAQNIAAKYAISKGYTFAIFSDQDTLYPTNYFQDLFEFTGSDVFAVVPSWRTLQNGVYKTAGVSVLDECKKNISLKYPSENVEVFHAISSGMLVNLEILLSLGFYNDDLFIDWVDNDICWRSYLAGYKIIVIPNVIITHSLGDSTIHFFGRSFTCRNHLRDYYIIRNAIYLLFYSFSSHKPIRCYLIKKIFQHSIISFCFSKNKLTQFKFISFAFFDGLTKRLGKKVDNV